MQPRSPKATPWLIALALLAGAGGCDGCRGKSPAPGAISREPALLASVPAGWERNDTTFSADGRHVGFVAAKDGQTVVFLDGRQGKPYENAWGIVLREGRGGLAHVAGKAGKAVVVVDGEEGEPYDEVRTVRFAPDGRVVYSAVKDKRWSIVVGTRATVVPGVEDPAPELSADGRRLVFAELEPSTGKTHLRACSLELAECSLGTGYDEIIALKLDSSRRWLAYLVGAGGKKAVGLVDLEQPGLTEKLGAWYDEIPLFSLSDAGGHLAYLARRGDVRFLVRDGAELPASEVESPMELVVSRSGRVAATTVGSQGMRILVDGKAIGQEQQEVSSPTFSPDGAQLAYVASRDDKSAVVVNGVTGPTFDRVVTPAFSADGTKVLYRARKAGERFVVEADTRAKTIREHPHYEEVYQVVVSPDGIVGYGVRTGQDLKWVVEKL